MSATYQSIHDAIAHHALHLLDILLEETGAEAILKTDAEQNDHSLLRNILTDRTRAHWSDFLHDIDNRKKQQWPHLLFRLIVAYKKIGQLLPKGKIFPTPSTSLDYDPSAA